MIHEHIRGLLWVFGFLAASMGIVTLAPEFALNRLLKLPVGDETGRFFARHWGAMAAVCGGLMMWAAEVPALRGPVMAMVGVEKLVLIALTLGQWGKPLLRGLAPAAGCDLVAVVLFALYACEPIARG
jgi:hypothetical protein